MIIPYIMKKIMFQKTNQNTIMYYNYWTYVHQLSYPLSGPRIGGIIHQRPAFFQRAALLADPLPWSRWSNIFYPSSIPMGMPITIGMELNYK